MVIENFNRALDNWIKELDQKTFIQLCTKPSATSWSLGQVCNHLIINTNYYLGQAEICLSTDDHRSEEMSPDAKIMFRNNAFPNEVIEGPPENAHTPQPESKEELMRNLLKLKEEINRIGILISKSTSKGKTKHPGLNYFSAMEWLQFGEMHFRHHLRQKQRIEKFLTK